MISKVARELGNGEQRHLYFPYRVLSVFYSYTSTFNRSMWTTNKEIGGLASGVLSPLNKESVNRTVVSRRGSKRAERYPHGRVKMLQFA